MQWNRIGKSMKGFGKWNERAYSHSNPGSMSFHTSYLHDFNLSIPFRFFNSENENTLGSFILGRFIFLWYISTMAVFDVEFLTIILSAFVISRIDPVVNLLHRVRARAPYHRLDSSRTDDLSPTRRRCVRRCSEAHSEELQR